MREQMSLDQEDEEDFNDDEEILQDQRRSRDPSWFGNAFKKIGKIGKTVSGKGALINKGKEK